MGKYKSPLKLSGKVGEIVLTADGRIRSRPNVDASKFKTHPQYANSRAGAQEFGGASKAMAEVRQGLGPLLKLCPKAGLSERLIKLMRTLQAQMGCGQIDRTNEDLSWSSKALVDTAEKAAAQPEWELLLAKAVSGENKHHHPLVWGERSVPLTQMGRLISQACNLESKLKMEDETVWHCGCDARGATHVRAMIHFFTLSDMVWNGERKEYQPEYQMQQHTHCGTLVPLVREGQGVKVCGLGTMEQPLKAAKGETVMCGVLVQYVKVVQGKIYPLRDGMEWMLMEWGSLGTEAKTVVVPSEYDQASHLLEEEQLIEARGVGDGELARR